MYLGWLKQTELLELLSNRINKYYRRLFHDFGVGNPAELLELPSNED